MGNRSVRGWWIVAVTIAGCVGGSPIVSSWSVTSAQSVAVREAPEGSARLVTLDVDHATLKSVLQEIARQAGLTPLFGPAVVNSMVRVKVTLDNVRVQDAFERVLRGTGLRANIGAHSVAFGAVEVGASVTQGGITGTVIDSKTKQPLRGANVTLDGVGKRTVTGDDGHFRLSGIVPGAYTLQVRMLGYVKTAKSITVVEGQAVSVEVAMDPSVNALDQVVVTGTVASTELKAVPNAMTVITAKELEQRGITRIDQLFRGDVPGTFVMNSGSGNALDQVVMYVRGATRLDEQSNTIQTPSSAPIPGPGESVFTGFSNPIKTYLDGVELVDPSYLSQIDSRSIERIEIITGPQASTIYGSNAINGVMQIFTKRSRSARPQLTVSALSGFVQNDFTTSLTPQHIVAAQLQGTEGHISYQVGGSWDYMGRWSPAKQGSRLSGFGGARMRRGAVTADASLRMVLAHNAQGKGKGNQYVIEFRETGWYTPSSQNATPSPFSDQTLMGQTFGATVGYVPHGWWSHEIVVGHDDSNTEVQGKTPGYSVLLDTLRYLSHSAMGQTSLRYTTTVQASVSSFGRAVVTVGVDARQQLASALVVSPNALTGTLTGTPTVNRQPDHNRGGFVQAQLGMGDHLFVTYGLRGEWNPNFGDDAEPNLAPRYGITYTQEWGNVTAKLRASYGRSTRPPDPRRKREQTVTEVRGSGAATFLPFYGNYIFYLANPDLGPEYQQGGEGGMEWYLGDRASLTVTRYNQTVDGLIASPDVDSVRSIVVNPTLRKGALDSEGYGYWYQSQYVNLGSVRNQGWEVQGTLLMGPFSTRGTYSWTKSRVIGITPAYRAQFTPTNFPQYQPGASFSYLPEHTWAGGVTYARARTTVAVNLTGMGMRTTLSSDQYIRNITNLIRLSANRIRMNTAGYANLNAGYVMADLNATRRLTPSVEGVVQVLNVGNVYRNDRYADFATLGRQTKFGVRLRY